VPHSEFVIEADTVAIAIGYNADPDIKDAAPGVATNRWNLVEVHPETLMTTRAGVFAGGDNVNGADLVVTALADGRRAAAAIHGYLRSLPPRYDPDGNVRANRLCCQACCPASAPGAWLAGCPRGAADVVWHAGLTTRMIHPHHLLS